MRIAIDAMLLGGRHSGVEVAIEGLCGAISQAASPHSFLIAHRDCYSPGTVSGPDVTTLAAPPWTRCRAGRIAWETWSFPAVAHRWGAHLVHAPGYVAPFHWDGPLVLNVYDILAITHPEWCRRANVLYYRRALPASIRRASMIVAPSGAVKAEIARAAGIRAGKIRVVHLGISDAMRPPEAAEVERVRRHFDLPRPYLIWVGNVEPKKNVAAMVDAFNQIAEDIPHDFVLVGKLAWKSESARRAIAASPFRDRVRLLGYAPFDDLPGLYAGSDLLVHWSLYEGAGLTPLEAMACGTRAIVSDGGALPELAGQVARVVPLGDPAQLSAAIQEELRRAPLDDSAMHWAQGFTWERSAREMIEVYEEAAALGS